MKHATANALDTIEVLLATLRKNQLLTERRRGVFYRKRTAFLHFHEDPAGMFAHIHLRRGWKRIRINSSSEKRELMRLVADALRDPA